MFARSCFTIAVLSVLGLVVIADVADARGGRRGRRGGCADGHVYVDPHHHHGHAMGYDSFGPGDPRTSFYYDPQSDLFGGSTLAPGSARVRVIVPNPEARVWFDGAATQQLGNDRWFHTSSLQSGANYSYKIRATWMENGREVNQERTVRVNPGQMTFVDFTKPAGEQLPPVREGAPSIREGTPQIREGTPQVQNLDGKIIRTGQDQVVIETRDNKQVTIYTNPQTRFMVNENPGAFTDLRVGSTINLGFTMQGDRRIANTIRIRP